MRGKRMSFIVHRPELVEHVCDTDTQTDERSGVWLSRPFYSFPTIVKWYPGPKRVNFCPYCGIDLRKELQAAKFTT